MRELDPHIVGANIRKLRTAKGLTQFALSAASGVALRAIANYEAGRSTPSAPSLAKLVGPLETTTDAVLAGLTA